MDIITAYAAAVTGQRSGVMTNLAIAEFNMREEGEQPGFVVIPCVTNIRICSLHTVYEMQGYIFAGLRNF